MLQSIMSDGDDDDLVTKRVVNTLVDEILDFIDHETNMVETFDFQDDDNEDDMEYQKRSDSVHVIVHEDSDESCNDDIAEIEIDDLSMSGVAVAEDPDESLTSSQQLAEVVENEVSDDRTSDTISIEDVQGIDVICGNCGEHFQSLRTLSLHLNTKHGSLFTNDTTNIEVIQDDEAASDGDSIEEHPASPVIFEHECQHCSKTFPSEKLMLHHRKICEKLMRSGITKSVSVPLEEVPISSLMCQVCLKIFHDPLSLQAHIKSEHEYRGREELTGGFADFSESDLDSDLESDWDDSGGILKIALGHKYRKTQKNKSSHALYLPDPDSSDTSEDVILSKSTTCTYCGKVLSNRSNMRKHVRKMHEKVATTTQAVKTAAENITYPTKQADHLISNGHDVSDHATSIYPVWARTCTYCGKVLSNRSNMRKHVRKMHEKVATTAQAVENAAENISYPMEETDNLILNGHNKNDHIISIYPFWTRTCTYCGKLLSNPSNMRKHVRKMHEQVIEAEQTVENSTDLASSTSKQTDHNISNGYKMNENETSVRPTKTRTCKYCDKVLSNPSNMRKHVKKMHENVVKPEQENPYELSFPVEHFETIEASESFENQVKHEDFPDGGTVVVITSNVEDLKKGNKKAHCPECSKLLSSQHALMEHMRTHTGERPFQCDECGRAFTTPRNLKKHTISIHSGMKPFKCDECGRDFALKSSLKAHSLSHTGTFRYHCSACNKGFQTPAALRRHEIIHTGERPYACNKCGKCFNDTSALKKHLFYHTGLKPHICDECGSAFATINSLRSHHLVHSGICAFTCEECGKGFRTNSSLQRHQRIHSGEKPFQCDFCGQDFAENWQLVSHRREHTGERPFECTHCGKRFVSVRKLTRHQHIHNPTHVCNVCGKSFTSSSFLKIHMYKHTGQHPHRCDKCMKGFATPSQLRRHLFTHTGIKPFVCDSCGKRFTSIMGLRNHTSLHTGIRPYVCETCGKGFPNKTALKIHTLFHETEKKFQCDLCGRKFHRIYEMNSHRITHSNEKSFKCKLCDKAYHHKSALDAHTNTHTEEKWYSCEECNKSFLREATLKKHMKTHALVKPYPCDQCDKRFGRKEHLRRHMATHSSKSALQPKRAEDFLDFQDDLRDSDIMNLEGTSIVEEHVEMELSD